MKLNCFACLPGCLRGCQPSSSPQRRWFFLSSWRDFEFNGGRLCFVQTFTRQLHLPLRTSTSAPEAPINRPVPVTSAWARRIPAKCLNSCRLSARRRRLRLLPHRRPAHTKIDFRQPGSGSSILQAAWPGERAGRELIVSGQPVRTETEPETDLSCESGQ